MSLDKLFDGSDAHLLNDKQDGFEEMVDKGTEAWADVPDATEWVEDIRGNE